MLGGQSVDVENEKNDIQALDKELLDYIYLNKTAALLEAPLMIGRCPWGSGKGRSILYGADWNQGGTGVPDSG